MTEGIAFSSLALERQNPGRRRYYRQIRRRRLRTYLHPFFRTTHPTGERFIVLSQMRAGSHLVRSLLSSHPSVYCDGELFAQLRTLSPRLLLKNAMGARPEHVYGFLLKPHNPYHNQHSTTERWIDWLAGEGFKLIYLRREDMLRQALSGYLAIERQIWIRRKGADSTVAPMEIDVARLLRIRGFIESWIHTEASWVDALPSIAFSYERDLECEDKHQSTMDAIFDFLGVDSFPVEASIARVLPADPHEYVTNWDEVATAWRKAGS